jgi:hypothetical protein
MRATQMLLKLVRRLPAPKAIESGRLKTEAEWHPPSMSRQQSVQCNFKRLNAILLKTSVKGTEWPQPEISAAPGAAAFAIFL